MRTQTRPPLNSTYPTKNSDTFFDHYTKPPSKSSKRIKPYHVLARRGALKLFRWPLRGRSNPPSHIHAKPTSLILIYHRHTDAAVHETGMSLDANKSDAVSLSRRVSATSRHVFQKSLRRRGIAAADLTLHRLGVALSACYTRWFCHTKRNSLSVALIPKRGTLYLYRRGVIHDGSMH